jgi:S-adenosylmethionine synthetase
MSLEAAAGKNPVTHVGKLYNLLSFDLAHRIVEECGGDVEEVWVRIVSQIGKPIDQPQVAVAQLCLAKGVKIGAVKSKVEGIIDNGLETIEKLTAKVVAGKVRVF